MGFWSLTNLLQTWTGVLRRKRRRTTRRSPRSTAWTTRATTSKTTGRKSSCWAATRRPDRPFSNWPRKSPKISRSWSAAKSTRYENSFTSLVFQIDAIIAQPEMTYAQRSKCLSDASRFMHVHKLRAFFSLVDGLNFEQGARALLQATGIGKLRPNVLLMGYKNEWLLAPNEDMHQYFNVLQLV